MTCRKGICRRQGAGKHREPTGDQQEQNKPSHCSWKSGQPPLQNKTRHPVRRHATKKNTQTNYGPVPRGAIHPRRGSDHDDQPPSRGVFQGKAEAFCSINREADSQLGRERQQKFNELLVLVKALTPWSSHEMMPAPQASASGALSPTRYPAWEHRNRTGSRVI